MFYLFYFFNLQNVIYSFTSNTFDKYNLKKIIFAFAFLLWFLIFTYFVKNVTYLYYLVIKLFYLLQMSSRWLIIFILLAIIYKTSSQYRLDNQPAKKYCGSHLANMLSLVCKGQYNSLFDRRTISKYDLFISNFNFFH